MATYNYSNNPNVVFNPLSDVLFVDVGSAADLFVSQSGTSIVIVGSGHTATLQGVSPGQLSPANVTFFNESFMLVGDESAGTVNDEGPNSITGGNGNDLLIGLGGNDTLDGGQGNDRIYGNAGDDRINGSFGRDTVFGGQGNDLVQFFANSTGVLIYGNLGSDDLRGGTGADTMFGGQGNDQLTGDNGHNLLHGNLGDDTFFSGNGNDTIFGGDGNDSILAGLGNNLIYGQVGNDTIGGPLNSGTIDTVFGGQGNDLISYVNSASSALIYGQFGDDVLIGGSSTSVSDTIFGGQGNDLLRGGVGHDFLTGGIGNDTFLISRNGGINDSGATAASADFVYDFFSGQDKIRVLLSGSGVPGTAANYNEFANSSVDNVPEAGQAYATSLTFKTYTFIAGSVSGFLVVDADTDGTADMILEIAVGSSLNSFAFTDIIG